MEADPGVGQWKWPQGRDRTVLCGQFPHAHSHRAFQAPSSLQSVSETLQISCRSCLHLLSNLVFATSATAAGPQGASLSLVTLMFLL